MGALSNHHFSRHLPFHTELGKHFVKRAFGDIRNINICTTAKILSLPLDAALKRFGRLIKSFGVNDLQLAKMPYVIIGLREPSKW